MIRLRTKRTKYGILYHVGIGFRLFCGAVLAFLLWGIILYLSEGESLSTMVLPLVLALLSLIGLLYRETWSFDPGAQVVIAFFGFGPFVSRHAYPYGEVECLELTHFVRGSMDKDAVPSRKKRKQAMVVFSLALTKDDERKTIEIIPERTSEGKTEQAAQYISAVSDLPLVMDRERDLDLHVSLRDL
jgi:hypothetical protein